MRSIVREYRAILDSNYSQWFTDIYRVLDCLYGNRALSYGYTIFCVPLQFHIQ